MGYYDYGYWPRYVSVGEKRAKAQRKLEQLRKKNPNIQPIILEGRSLAQTWWGKAWNKNLERYADYSNRIGRGRSYVRHGAVLDLQIAPGKVTSLVHGSGRKPYKVEIKIKPIGKALWQQIKADVAGELASLQALLDGRFPKALGEIFTAQGKGLFPTPKEIDFDCSCPDWASMCKHVAATLYGIGARLDEDPSLFFVLRKAKIDDLISQTVRDQSQKLLEKSKRKTSRVMDDTDLGDVFGIDLEDATPVKKPKRKIKKTKTKAKRAEPKRKAKKEREGEKGRQGEGERTKKTTKKKVIKKKTVKKRVTKKAIKKKVVKKKAKKVTTKKKKKVVKKKTR